MSFYNRNNRGVAVVIGATQTIKSAWHSGRKVWRSSRKTVAQQSQSTWHSGRKTRARSGVAVVRRGREVVKTVA